MDRATSRGHRVAGFTASLVLLAPLALSIEPLGRGGSVDFLDAAAAEANACSPEGAAIRCVWERELLLNSGLSLPGDVISAEYRHTLDVPFAADIALDLTWLEARNELSLELAAGPASIYWRDAETPRRVAFNHTLLQPAALRVDVWADLVVGDRYRLEAVLLPVSPSPGPVEQRWEGSAAAGTVGAELQDSVPVEVHGPLLANVEFSFQSPMNSATLSVRDALGRLVTQTPSGSSSSRLGFFASAAYAYGTWYMVVRGTTLLGSNVQSVNYVASFEGVAQDEASLVVPAPVAPRELLLADTGGDAGDPQLDVLGVWYSDDTDEALSTHLLIANLPSQPAPREGELWRYLVGWRYADANVSVFADVHTNRTLFFARVEPGGGQGAQQEAAIPGRLDPGTPGVLTFLSPKQFIGSPAPGQRLERILATTERVGVAAPGGLALPLPGSSEHVDTASTELPYAVGLAAASGPPAPAPAVGSNAAPAMLLAGVFVVVPAAILAVAVLRRRAAAKGAEASWTSRYRIERELGQGSFGRALLAHDTLLDRRVVVKQSLFRLEPQSAAWKRFLQEARLAARIHHPNVVSIYEVLPDADPPVLVLEYVDGGSLEDLLEKRGRLPPGEGIRIGADILLGLERIHEAGIVHRDLKPANILLDRRGVAKVTDFGVARPPPDAQSAPTLATGTSQPGSVAYMSPEQAQGGMVDERTDIYAVGALLFRVLAGRHYMDLTGTPEEVRRLIPTAAPQFSGTGLPAAVANVIERAMRKDPTERFPSAAAMRKALLADPAAPLRSDPRGKPGHATGLRRD